MHEAQSKSPQHGKPESAGESSSALASDSASPTYAQMMPAYALGPGLPGVSLLGFKAQTKLTVGRPDDPHEREADSVAQRVTSGQPAGSISALSTLGVTRTLHRQIDEHDDQIEGPTLAQTLPLQRQATDEEVAGDEDRSGEVAQPLLQKQSLEDDEESADPGQRPGDPVQMQLLPAQSLQTPGGACSACNIQRLCKECEEKEQQGQAGEMVQTQSAPVQAPEPELEEQQVQSKGDQGPPATVTTSVAANVNSLNGGGSALPESARAYFEPRFGADFSQVRTHTDSGAAQTAKSLRARAFTVGENIAFGAGEYAPDSDDGRLLLAHELTHVVQQGAGGSAAPVARRKPEPVIQRALYWEADGVSNLLLFIPFRNERIPHYLTLDPDVASFFNADSDLAANVENALERVFNPAARPLRETRQYLESGAVRQLIVRGIRQLVTTGSVNFSELSTLLTRRTELFYEQDLLPEVTDRLASAVGIDPAQIDWNVLIPLLRVQARNFVPASIIDASLRDRYEMFLGMLASEAEALPPVVGAAAIDPVIADNTLFAFVINQGSRLFSRDVFAYHSESFVEEYLPLLQSIDYVPEQFDLEDFRPMANTWRLDDARERIVRDFIAREGESRAMMYILDRWTATGASPEVFLRNLDLQQFRQEITAALAAELLRRARLDPELMAAVRSRATDQARFTQVLWMVGYARRMEQHNRRLGEEIFRITPLDELSSEDLAIAANPAGYYNTSLQVSRALYDFFTHISPNAPIEAQTITATADVLRALDMSPGYAPLFLLVEVLGYLGSFRATLEQQERETQRALQERLDLDYDHIAGIVNAFAEHADRFINETWIPMLKQVAIEYVTNNRDDLRYQFENWPALRRQRAIEAAQGVAELEFLANELESGRVESVEVEGQRVGRSGVQHLRDAASLLRAFGLSQLDDWTQFWKRAKVGDAISDYDQVIEDIRDGTYDPLDYSSAVYAEARRRLGIEALEGVTYGMALRREVVARNNPFLEYAIVRWQYFAGVERSMDRALTLLGLGLLTLAAAIVPGAIGVILGAIDIGVGIYNAVEGVREARATLRMARLDIYGSIVGISEADAEEALNDAWINLGVTLVLSAGVGALQARAHLNRPGGARVPRLGGATSVTRAESRLLREGAELHGSQLRPQQLNAEAQVASRSPSRPSTLPGFEEEIRLANDHVWRRRGSSWCRFSTRPFCMPDANLPTALRRRAYRDVAKTLDEGIDPRTRAYTAHRGHSFADHGAHTTAAQHEGRLRTGLVPSRTRVSATTASAKFATHRAHLDAYQMALDNLSANYLRTRGTARADYAFDLQLPGCGKVYTLGPGGALVETTANRFHFFFRQNIYGWYDLIDMYPIL